MHTCQKAREEMKFFGPISIVYLVSSTVWVVTSSKSIHAQHDCQDEPQQYEESYQYDDPYHFNYNQQSSSVDDVSVATSNTWLCDYIDLDYFTTCYIVGPLFTDDGLYKMEFLNIEANGGPTNNGSVVYAIKLWKDSTGIRGGKLLVNNLSAIIEYNFGIQNTEESDMFYFGMGEKVTEATLWGDSTKFQGVKIVTDKDRTFEFKSGNGDAYNIDVGSGIFIGMYTLTYQTDDVRSVGLAFLRPVAKSLLKNVDYPNILSEIINSKPIRQESIVYDNSAGSQDQTYMLTVTESVVEREAWSVATAVELSVTQEFSVEAGALFAKVQTDLSFSLTIGVESTFGRSNEKSTSRSFEFPITAGAGEQVNAKATIYEGSIDTPYTATMSLVLDTGTEYLYTVEGIYSGVTTSATVVSTETLIGSAQFF